MANEGTKTCSNCRTVKPLADYHVNRAANDGRQHRCKACALAARAAYRKKNLAAVREQDKAYCRAKAQERRDKQRAYYEQTRQTRKEARAAFNRRMVEEISPAYVAGMLKMPVAEVPADLMQLKTDELALRRLARLLKERCDEDEQDR